MDHHEAIVHLRKDKILSPLTDRYSVPPIIPSANLFGDLLESIVSQQLSIKAANTIFRRFLALFPEKVLPEPVEILKIDDEILRSCGLSRQKASYLKSLSTEIISENLDLRNLNNLSDEEVITSLTKVKGIGRWTAEMFLIFTLGRPDIFSLGDLGLCTAVSRLYGVERGDLSVIKDISSVWTPHRSLASRFLWKSLENS